MKDNYSEETSIQFLENRVDFINKGLFNIEIKTEEIEHEFQEFLVDNYIKIKICLNITFLIIILIRMIFSMYTLNQKYLFSIDIFFFIYCSFLVAYLIMFVKKKDTLKSMNNLISINFILYNIYTIIVLHFFSDNSINNIQIRNIYLSIIMNILILIFSFEINCFIFFFLFILFFFTLSFISFLNFEKDPFRFKDILYFVIIFLSTYYLKRENSINLRINFINGLKNKENLLYYYEISDIMNKKIITIDDNFITRYNKNFKEFIFNPNLNLVKLPEINKGNSCIKSNIMNSNITFKSKENILKKFCNTDLIINTNNILNEIVVNKPDFDEKEINNNHFNENGIINNYNLNTNTMNEFNLKNSKEICKFNNTSINFNNSSLKLISNNQDTSSKIKNEKNDLNYLKLDLNINQSKIQDKSINNDKQSDTILNDRSNSDEINYNYFSNLFINIEKKKYKVYMNLFKKHEFSQIFSIIKSQNLINILHEINELPLNIFNLDEFSLLGIFYLKLGGQFYEIYLRRLKSTKIMELIINDIYKIKEQIIEPKKNSKMFAKIAHEFKTPLNSIIGLIKMLNMDILDSSKSNNVVEKNEFKSILNQIENISNYVIFLITDIIDYSTINTHNYKNKINKEILNLKIEKINLFDVTNFCSEITRSLVFNKGKENFIKVENDFDNRVNLFDIFSNEFRLKQILVNILSNSVKFTRTGFIKVKTEIVIDQKIDCINDSFNNNISKYFSSNNIVKFDNKKYIYKIKISIIDSGIGLKEKDLESILKFKDFNMIESGKSLNNEGSGLGLSITNQIVKELKHEMTVESEKGKGSCFSIFINVDNSKNDNMLIINKSKSNFIEKNDKIDKHIKYKEKKEDLNKCDILLEDIILKSQISFRDSRNQNLNIDDCNCFKKNKCKYLKSEYYDSNNFDIYCNASERILRKEETKNSDRFKSMERKNNMNHSNTSINLQNTIALEDNEINNYLSDVNFFRRLICNNAINSKSELNSSDNVSSQKKSTIRSSFLECNNNSKTNTINNQKSIGSDSRSLPNSYLKNFSNNEFEMLASIKNRFKTIRDNRSLILIVDDNKDIRNSLRNIIDRALIKLKMDVFFATDEGEDGSFIIRKIIKDQYRGNMIKLVITDENMEFINGSQAVKILKDFEKDGLIKSVVYACNSSNDDSNTFVYLEKCGIKHFLPKFCDMEKIISFFQQIKLFDK